MLPIGSDARTHPGVMRGLDPRIHEALRCRKSYGYVG